MLYLQSAMTSGVTSRRAGHVFRMPEAEVAEVLGAHQREQRFGRGGGVGGDVGGFGLLAVPEGRRFVLGLETGVQKRKQLRGRGHGYSWLALVMVASKNLPTP